MTAGSGLSPEATIERWQVTLLFTTDYSKIEHYRYEL
jgi:hypothetical protein